MLESIDDEDVERAPIIQPAKPWRLKFPVGDSDDIIKDEDLRVPQLTDKLQEMRKVDEMMHPGAQFKGQIIINADKDVEFKLVRKVMMASAEAGYTAINYAVLSVGPAKKEGEGGEDG